MINTKETKFEIVAELTCDLTAIEISEKVRDLLFEKGFGGLDFKVLISVASSSIKSEDRKNYPHVIKFNDLDLEQSIELRKMLNSLDYIKYVLHYKQ